MTRQPIRQRSFLTRTPVVVALSLVAGGCASLDPAPEIGRAASTIGERSGVTPAWTQPWEAALTTWDGRSPLMREAALVMALRNNREIRSQVEQIAASRADLVQAGLLPNPVLGLALRFPVDPVSGGTLVGASVVQSFTALWLRGGRISAADARLNQTVLDVSDRALRLVSDVKATHARIAFGERALVLSEENLATIRKSIDSLDARVRGGEGTTLDVNRARQQLAKSEAERAVVARDLAKERRVMLELIGFAAENAEWTVDGSGSMPPAPPLDESVAIALALSQRLDVAAARLVVTALQTDLSTEERSRLRDFGLGAEFERETDGSKSLGPVLEVGIPIFDTNAAQIARAGSLARAALASYEATSQRAVREARTAWIDLDTASRLTEQYRAGVLAIAERNLTLAEAALRAGQADVTVLLEAQSELIEARRTLLDLERDGVLAAIELERAVGGAVLNSPESTTSIPR